MKSLKLTSNLKFSLSKNFNTFSKLSTLSAPKANFGDRIKDKEQAEERFYFDKEERRLAQNLLKKLRKERKEEPLDEETYKQKERLKRLLEVHHENFSEALIDDILKWKKTHSHHH